MVQRPIFSFIVDDDPSFLYEGWYLACSIIEHCGGDASRVVVQLTPEVPESWSPIFLNLGCKVMKIARFGDGRYCNKLNQLDNLRDIDFDCAVLLDTDTIVLADLSPFLSSVSVVGKIVDVDNPPLHILEEIGTASGLDGLPPVCRTDAGTGETYLGNCNGGFYSVPKPLCDLLSAEWRRWAHWLLQNSEPLVRVGKQQHIDQVSFWLAVNHSRLPFELAPSNVNYYVHIADGPTYYDANRPVTLLHYHVSSLDVVGLIQPRIDPGEPGRTAVLQANEQIGRWFDNRVFWEMRYKRFPDRGSGVGSRGDNIVYKRELMRNCGVEAAASVLDVGCGDLEVMKDMAIRRYVGIDQSPEALVCARRARPDWEFHLAGEAFVQPAEMVVCFEVLIHQKNSADYFGIIDFLASKTLGSLLVSGFAEDTEQIRQNKMVFFHEALTTSLTRTGRFSRIRQVGSHTSVAIYHCIV